MFLPSVPIDCLWGICIIISSILNNIRMKVKVGFIEGAEEWQINFFLRRFQKIDGSVLEFEIDKERADFLIAFPWLYLVIYVFQRELSSVSGGIPRKDCYHGCTGRGSGSQFEFV